MSDWGKFKEEVFNWINSLGINPIYPITLIVLLISYFNLKKLKRWNELPLHNRMFTTVSWLATILIVIACVFSILNNIKKLSN